MDTTVVRRLAPEDWEHLRRIRLEALAEAPQAFGSTLSREEAFDEATWRSRCVTSAQFVATNGGVACGLVAVYVPASTGGEPAFGAERYEHGPQLVSMWVAPSHRRRGVASALVGAALDHARGEGASTVQLWVADGNEGARALYESLGFIPTGVKQPLPSRPDIKESQFSCDLASSS